MTWDNPITVDAPWFVARATMAGSYWAADLQYGSQRIVYQGNSSSEAHDAATEWSTKYQISGAGVTEYKAGDTFTYNQADGSGGTKRNIVTVIGLPPLPTVEDPIGTIPPMDVPQQLGSKAVASGGVLLLGLAAVYLLSR